MTDPKAKTSPPVDTSPRFTLEKREGGRVTHRATCHEPMVKAYEAEGFKLVKEKSAK